VRADPASQGGHFTHGLLDPEAIVPPEVKGLSSRRYGVYRNNVTVGLVRAMEANFPIVRRLLGEEYFAGFARQFVQKHPPQSPLMFEYGAAFSDFLAADDDLRSYPYLGDMARLEQQLRLSHHEADAQCLAAYDLAQLPEDQLMEATFKPHPAMSIVSSPHAIHSIYRANLSDHADTVSDTSEAQAVLVTRPGYEVILHRLQRPDLAFVESLAIGCSLGAAADIACGLDPDFDITAAISLLLTSGALLSPQT
jgi:hypothetical protein